MNGPTATLPWTRRHLAGSAIVTALAGLLVASGWVGTSGASSVDDQLPWLLPSAAGLLAAAFTGASVVAGARRAIGERIAPLAKVAPVAPLDVVETLVSGPDMSRYHRPDCLLTRDKDLEAATRHAHEQAGLRPCGMCRP